MEVSANEFRTVITKACVGAGVSRGVAIEIADACLSLTGVGRVPVVALLDALRKFDATAGPANWQDDGGWRANGFHVLRDGPSAMDLAEVGKRVFVELEDSTLLLGLAYARALASGFEVLASGDGTDWWNVAETMKLAGEDDGLKQLWLRRGDAVAVRNIYDGPTHVQDDEWNELCAFARAVLVPADDTTRADAGAGLTDND